MRIRRSSKLMRFEPITLVVALNNEDSASGIVYFDDEESYDYEESEKFYLKKLMFQKNELFIASLHEGFKISNKIERIIISGLDKKVKNIYYENFYGGEKSKSKLEYVVKDNNIIEIKRLQISFDNIWKVKLEYID
jgi:alpha 1,3-glucosidase